MQSWRRVVTATTTITMAVGVLAALPAAAATDRQIQEAQDYRRDFALASSKAVARDSWDKSGKYSDMSRGIPLTPAEASEMDRRNAIVRKLDVAKEVARNRDGFAEMYIDHAKGGIPVFLFTEGIQGHRAALAAEMPDGVGFEVKKVEYTTKQLKNKMDAITKDMLKSDWVLAGNIAVASVAEDVVANRVSVGLVDADDAARARSILRESYGQMVDVEFIGLTENDCASRNNCRNPMKGGLKIARNGTFRCTSGFQAERNGSVRVMLTAGHCITENGGSSCSSPQKKWDHNSSPFGCAKGESLPQGGGLAYSDTGWINLDSNDDDSPRNRVFGQNSSDIRIVNQVLSGSDLTVNEKLCRSSGAGQWKCGQLKNKCVNKPNGEGWTIECTASVAKDSTGGDSGGSWLREKSGDNVAAAGIHVHSSNDSCTTCRSWFSKANRAENDSDSTICTTSSC